MRVFASILAFAVASCCIGYDCCAGGGQRKDKSISVRFQSFYRTVGERSVFENLRIHLAYNQTDDTLDLARHEQDTLSLRLQKWIEDADTLMVRLHYKGSVVFSGLYETHDSVLHTIVLSPNPGMNCASTKATIPLEAGFGISICHDRTTPSCP